MTDNVKHVGEYIIPWDVNADNATELWKGTGVVQSGSQSTEPSEIYRVPGRVYGFDSSEEAWDYIIGTAKGWIGDKLDGIKSPS